LASRRSDGHIVPLIASHIRIFSLALQSSNQFAYRPRTALSPSERRGQVLLIYAARHYRELSAQNELRPQNVMRMLVHYHAYGDAAKVPGLIADHSGRIRRQIDLREEDEVGRLQAEYEVFANRLATLDANISAACTKRDAAKTKGDKAAAETALAKLEKSREKLTAKLIERNERITEAGLRAQDDHREVNHKFELGRKLDWEVAGLLPMRPGDVRRHD
jgi:hypothetical protein